jgi:hypothetical protein
LLTPQAVSLFPALAAVKSQVKPGLEVCG